MNSDIQITMAVCRQLKAMGTWQSAVLDRVCAECVLRLPTKTANGRNFRIGGYSTGMHALQAGLQSPRLIGVRRIATARLYIRQLAVWSIMSAARDSF
jgi:hypothetical protein